MILYDTKFNDKLHLELVDGIDVAKTVRFGKPTLALPHHQIPPKSIYYARPDLPNRKLVRLVKTLPFVSVVVLHALVWNALDSDNQEHLVLDYVNAATTDEYIGLREEFSSMWMDSCSGLMADDYRHERPRLRVILPDYDPEYRVSYSLSIFAYHYMLDDGSTELVTDLL